MQPCHYAVWGPNTFVMKSGRADGPGSMNIVWRIGFSLRWQARLTGLGLGDRVCENPHTTLCGHSARCPEAAARVGATRVGTGWLHCRPCMR